MSTWTRVRLWWYRRRMHRECAENQLRLWRGHEVATSACTKCLPRMIWIRDVYTPRARIANMN